MTTNLVEGKITALDTFASWQAADEERRDAFDAVPFHIDTNDRDQVRGQLRYLDSQAGQQDARRALMVEIATQGDDFLSLPYRLGALAAFKATNGLLATKRLKSGWLSDGSAMLGYDHEQQLHPSSDPLTLAAQMGGELERLRGILDTEDNVPVVMVWNHRFLPPRIDYDVVVRGEVVNPRESFVLEAPKVIEIEGQEAVDYTIPTKLNGVKKGQVVRSDEYVQPEDKYKNPDITTLIKLGVRRSRSHSPNALYIGSEEVEKRLAKAELDKANYDRQRNRQLEAFRSRRRRLGSA